MANKKVTGTTAKGTKKTAPVETVKAVLNAENVGFKAGDVYQALAAEGREMTVEEIASKANISVEEALLGIGWLFKEYKIVGNGDKVELA